MAWITERKDLVFVFFGLLALIAWGRYRQRPSGPRYLLLLVAYAASLMGKSMLVTFPVLLLILDGWLARGTPVDWKKKVLEKVPLFALGGLVGLSTLVAQRSAGAMQSLQLLPFADRLATAPRVLWKFLGLTLWPANLSAYYPREVVPTWEWVLALAACLAIGVALFVFRRRVPDLAFGTLWFVVSLLPVSGLLQVGGALAADRYLYWPHLGLFAGLILSVPSTFASRPAARAAAAFAAAGLAMLTAFQLPVWRDSETLFRATLEAEPNNPFMQTSLGLLLLKQGRASEALEPLSKAAPRSSFGQSIYGLALIETGALEAGLRALEEAGRRAPSDPGVTGNVALGKARLEALRQPP